MHEMSGEPPSSKLLELLQRRSSLKKAETWVVDHDGKRYKEIDGKLFHQVGGHWYVLKSYLLEMLLFLISAARKNFSAPLPRFLIDATGWSEGTQDVTCKERMHSLLRRPLTLNSTKSCQAITPLSSSFPTFVLNHEARLLGLFIGAQEAATNRSSTVFSLLFEHSMLIHYMNREGLAANNVKHILNVATGIENYFPEVIACSPLSFIWPLLS